MPVSKRKYNGLDAIVLDDGTSEVIVTIYALFGDDLRVLSFAKSADPTFEVGEIRVKEK